MNNQSICKHNFNLSNDLVCSVFVLERTDAQAQYIKNQEYSVNLVIKGNGTLIVNNKKYDLHPNTIFFICRGETSFIERNDMEYAYIRFSGRRAEEYVQRLDLSGKNRLLSADEDLGEFWLNCLSKTYPHNVDLLSESVLLYSLSHIQSNIQEENDTISQVVRILGERFTDSDLSLSEIANEIGYNDKYISILFKKQRGITYTQYLTELRLSHAIFLVEQGINNVSNVANLSGFTDAMYFSRIFKRHKGISPKEFIKNSQMLRK